jgi:hypothetical protein
MFQKQLLLGHAIRSLLASENERFAEQLATSFLEHGPLDLYRFRELQARRLISLTSPEFRSGDGNFVGFAPFIVYVIIERLRGLPRG